MHKPVILSLSLSLAIIYKPIACSILGGGILNPDQRLKDQYALYLFLNYDTVFLLPPPTLSLLSNLYVPFVTPPPPPPPTSHQNLGLPHTTMYSTPAIFPSALPPGTDQKFQVGIHCVTAS